MTNIKKLLVNGLLAFVAGFTTSFGTFVLATDANPGAGAIIAAAAAAAYAGFRVFVGYALAASKSLPAIPTDV